MSHEKTHRPSAQAANRQHGTFFQPASKQIMAKTAVALSSQKPSHFVDESGAYLGEGMGKRPQRVYVISKNSWNSVKNPLSDDGGKILQANSTYLAEYAKGIIVPGSVWTKMNDSDTDVIWEVPSVKNSSSHTIYFKPEGDYGSVKNNGAYPLAAGLYLYAPIDGVSAKHIKKNAVYKVPDGNMVNVSDKAMNTDVIATDNGIGVIISFFADLIKGGWIEGSPDSSWDQLYETSK